jgi:uncharacterized membrane protein (UPF0127 family)
MAGSRNWVAIAVVCCLLIGSGLVAAEIGAFEQGDYESTTVTAVDSETGEQLAAVDVRIADTYEKRYTGLSNTSSLGEDEGMVFIHNTEGERTYVMREMAFPIDIVFISADGEITAIHNAELEADQSDLTGYSGTAQYVLEVPYEYTTDHGIAVGDRIEIPERYR